MLSFFSLPALAGVSFDCAVISSRQGSFRSETLYSVQAYAQREAPFRGTFTVELRQQNFGRVGMVRDSFSAQGIAEDTGTLVSQRWIEGIAAESCTVFFTPAVIRSR